MSRGASPHFFTAVGYGGFWIPFDGNRLALRQRIETLLRRECNDPGGFLEVRGDGPHWIGSQLHVSYSHSQDQALVVYSRLHALGVDIERADRVFAQEPAALAERFFHPSEVAAASDPARFLPLWCQKEALGKLSRGGLKDWLSRPVAECPPGVRVMAVPVVPTGWIAMVAVAG